MVFIEKINPEHSKKCYLLDYETISLWTMEQWQNELLKKEAKAFGIFDDKRVIGILLAHIIINEAEILYLSVHPDFRRTGLGSELINEFLNYCETFKIKRILLEVCNQNHSAVSFYKKFNFKTLNLRRGYYRNGKDAILKEKILLKI